jgi:Holliday junction resolvase RusA-like endonuclease
MSPIIIEIAGAPQGKGRGRSALIKPKDRPSFISTFTPASTRKYEAHFKLAAQQVMGDRPLLQGAVWLRIDAAMPIPASWSGKKQREAAAGMILPTGRPDLDNIIKMCDALKNVVWRDDTQICFVVALKFYAERPSLRVEAREIDLSARRTSLADLLPETLPLFAVTA